MTQTKKKKKQFLSYFFSIVMITDRYMEEEKEKIRCCNDCKTTKTPMWRGGPAGPKSLCNACGIRLRRQRRSELLDIRIVHNHKVLASKKIKPSSLHGGVAVKKRRRLKEEEQAALCLLLLSCSSVFASEGNRVSLFA